MKKLKEIIKSLERQHLLLNELIQERGFYVDDKSEKWQESGACEEYESKTNDIENQAEELFNVISELKEL